ncbi:hypothetical protein AAVH_01681 [Aphelenchoides avenae]|nr:hypothetical protein AAVH_01681 [Aphelenchus avenae]
MSFVRAALLAALVGLAAARPQNAQVNVEGESADKALLARNLAHFFKSLDSSQQTQLKTIFQDQSLTKGQIKEKIQQFIQTLPADKQEQAKNIHNQIEQAIKDKVQQFENKNLSPNARQAFTEFKQILQDDSITPKQECEQIVNKLKTLSVDDRKTLSVPENFDFDCNKIGQFDVESQRAALPAEGSVAVQGKA